MFLSVFQSLTDIRAGRLAELGGLRSGRSIALAMAHTF